MKRVSLAVVALLLAMVATTGCQRTVEVETGVRIECPYGHVDTSGVQIVKVRAKVASAYRVTSEKRVCDRHRALEALYAEAQAALTSGDTKTAQAKLTQIAEQEEGFRNADKQLSEIEGGGTPAPDNSSGPSTSATATPKPGEGDTSSPIGSLKKYVPNTLDGFTGRPVITEPLAITRQYDPVKSSKALLLTVVAEQFRTNAEADRALNSQMARYPKSSSAQQDGSRTLRFGSDGRRFVSVAFTNKSVLVILELGVRAGVDPIKMKSTILDAAKALP